MEKLGDGARWAGRARGLPLTTADVGVLRCLEVLCMVCVCVCVCVHDTCEK